MIHNDYILTKAKDSNIPELIKLLCLMPDEADTIYPPYNKNIMAKYLKNVITQELCLILIKDTKIVGTIGGVLSRFWWSENKILINSFLFILQEHRNYVNAKKLITSFNKIGEKHLVPVIMGTSDAKDMERKDMLFNKLGFRKLGGQYGAGV
tara:strand:+ start:311 stop:766 length:456 start_codon:yes stop_codon:yes gene_type:complete